MQFSSVRRTVERIRKNTGPEGSTILAVMDGRDNRAIRNCGFAESAIGDDRDGKAEATAIRV
jgi:hypothetical protein